MSYPSRALVRYRRRRLLASVLYYGSSLVFAGAGVLAGVLLFWPVS